ncbi:MAG: hypothetical protein ACI4XP_06815 [Acutalibacteraceae bacterium]
MQNRKKLFGNSITPSCDYCQYVTLNNEGKKICRMGVLSLEKPCRKYTYDPLKREPKPAPELPKFTADDFKI